jgi:hypothetical protein
MLLFFAVLFTSCSKELSRSEAEKLIVEYYQLPYDDAQEFSYKEVTKVKYTVPFHYYPEYIQQRTSWGYVSQVEDHNKRIAKQEEAVRNANFALPDKLIKFRKLEDDGLIDYVINIGDIEMVHQHNSSREGSMFTKEGSRTVYKDIQCEGNAYHTVNLTEKGKKYLSSDNKIITSRIVFYQITGIVNSNETNQAKVEYQIARTNISPFGQHYFNITDEIFDRKIYFRLYDDGWRIEK